MQSREQAMPRQIYSAIKRKWWSTDWMWIKSNSLSVMFKLVKLGSVCLFEHLFTVFISSLEKCYTQRTKWEIALIRLGCIRFKNYFWPQLEHKNREVNNEPLRQEQTQFPFKGLVSSPIRLSYAASIISWRRMLTAPCCTRAASPPVSIIHLPTLHSWKLRDSNAAVMTGEIKWKGMKEQNLQKNRCGQAEQMTLLLAGFYLLSPVKQRCDAGDDRTQHIVKMSSVSTCFILCSASQSTQ